MGNTALRQATQNSAHFITGAPRLVTTIGQVILQTGQSPGRHVASAARGSMSLSQARAGLHEPMPFLSFPGLTHKKMPTRVLPCPVPLPAWCQCTWWLQKPHTKDRHCVRGPWCSLWPGGAPSTSQPLSYLLSWARNKLLLCLDTDS